MKLVLIGEGSIGRYVRREIARRNHQLVATLVRSQRLPDAETGLRIMSVADLPDDVDLVIDCAGHSALTAYGTDILQRGCNLLTVSLGALADEGLYRALDAAAANGGSRLYLACGAIGALDCLRAARIGGLDSVTYTGRKPPAGWKGSPAEDRLDLDKPGIEPVVHFDGTARDAATEYPKNANVAAAVALAGVGFDLTTVQLIADPSLKENVHEIEACGAFGRFSFAVRGNALPDNPRSSALAAMSVVAEIERLGANIAF